MENLGLRFKTKGWRLPTFCLLILSIPSLPKILLHYILRTTDNGGQSRLIAHGSLHKNIITLLHYKRSDTIFFLWNGKKCVSLQFENAYKAFSKNCFASDLWNTDHAKVSKNTLLFIRNVEFLEVAITYKVFNKKREIE